MRFDLPAPQPNFLFLPAVRGVLVIYSKAQFDAEGIDSYRAKSAGTGPFEFAGAQLGQGMEFTAVVDH